MSLELCCVCLVFVSDGFVMSCDEYAQGLMATLDRQGGLALSFVTRDWIVPQQKSGLICLFALSGLDLLRKWYEVLVIL
jgi:hypothetical protein